MAFSAFLKFDGITGESTDDKHKDWIDLLSFSWGVIQPGRAAGSGLAEKAQSIDFTYTHLLDKSSPMMLSASYSGRTIASALLEVCSSTGSKSRFYYTTMSSVMVSSVKNTGNLSVTPIPNKPTEEITLNFAKVQWTYSAVDSKGVISSPITGNWDLKTNKAF